MDNQNLKISIEKQEKFDFYFIALVFTILGASIQTSKLTTVNYQYCFEILSWVFLFLSGITGLSRLEWTSVFYVLGANIENKRNTKEDLEKAANGQLTLYKTNEQVWTEEEIETEIIALDKFINSQEEKEEKLQAKNLFKYRLHKKAFYLGLLCLLISRILHSVNSMLTDAAP